MIADPSRIPPERATVLAQVAALTRLDRAGMRDEWKRLFGSEAPGYGPDMMRRRLAYRVQELAYGGLSPSTRDRLQEIDTQAHRNKKKAVDPDKPVAGTVIIKEFKGERHEVLVLSDGYQYQGRRFDCLSPIAKIISGTNWNGWRFFGLRSRAGKEES